MEVAPILVPRADDTAGQQHPTLGMSPTPLSPVLSPKVAKPTDPAELAAAIRKQVRTGTRTMQVASTAQSAQTNQHTW